MIYVLSPVDTVWNKGDISTRLDLERICCRYFLMSWFSIGDQEGKNVFLAGYHMTKSISKMVETMASQIHRSTFWGRSVCRIKVITNKLGKNSGRIFRFSALGMRKTVPASERATQGFFGSFWASKRNWCAIAEGKESEQVLAHHTEQLNFTSPKNSFQRYKRRFWFLLNQQKERVR